jgi:23S rRNA (cytosine1962-C5)-methyltransferase
MALIERAGRPVRVLNLFGYTGGATAACLRANAEVTHVDAAKGMNQWAKDNIRLSGLEGGKCRILTDDVFKFVQREARRKKCYEAVIMDPPSYGRGPSGEVWKLENRLFELVRYCVDILSDKPLFMIINTYTAGFTHTAAENVLKLALSQAGVSAETSGGPLGLPISGSELILPCGACIRAVFR